jgi:hypothetical protein
MSVYIFQRDAWIEKPMLSNANLTIVGTRAYLPEVNRWYQVGAHATGHSWDYTELNTVPKNLRLMAFLLTGQT